MTQIRKVRILKNGEFQSVRLPPGFHFPAKEIYATRDEATGNITLSLHPGSEIWDEIFARFRAADVPNNFMKKRPMNSIPAPRALFEDANREDENRQ
ncbi:antitoxin [Silvibacterium sp.]|uniref:antitoxin n=1 Tax=Silvibacterium sp. TaxID=1964179 RepID=UPI0039E3B39F